MSPIS